MLKALLSFFGLSGSKKVSTCACESANLAGFVEYVVRALVDSPDKVRVTTEENADNSVIRIECNKEDIGKVVGKKGKTISAIRSLVRGAAGKMNKVVTVEVND
jgi:predicted RNA-binding protein YlqC (UPF0109 family)